MGEASKKRGEFGEDIVDNLLQLIGWEPNIKGVNIECINPIEHAIATRSRNTHGIDFIYQYDSPFFIDVRDFVLISSKFNDAYPSNPVSRLKSHVKDLASALECFRKSKLRNQLTAFDKNNRYIGVIFWLDNGKDNGYDDVIERLSDIRIESEFDAIYLVDNKRANFLYHSIAYAKNYFRESSMEFVIPNIGHNSTIKTRTSSSSILPVQYINTSILPLKIVQNRGTHESLVLNILDDFEDDHLSHLVSLAQKLTEGWSNQVHILYPRLIESSSREAIDKIKLEFRDQGFVRKIQIGTYMPGFRNV